MGTPYPYQNLAPPTIGPGPNLGKAPPMDLGTILSMIGNSSPEMGPAGTPVPYAASQVTPGMEQGLSPEQRKILSGLGNPNAGAGSQMTLGPAGLPDMIGAPKLAAPDYRASDLAFANAKPTPLSAPTYVHPNYAASDSLWDQARPHGATDQQFDDDKWGRILSGFASSALGADSHKLLAGIIGGLGGYGTALQNRTKMGVEEADKQSRYLMEKAGYVDKQITGNAEIDNNQQTANYNTDRTNNAENSSFYSALGRHDESKAENIAAVENKSAEMQFTANARNADILAQKRGAKVIGQNKNDVIYQWIDKDGNLNIGTKPIASFSGVNGNAQGKIGSGDPGMAGLEVLINTMRSNGSLRTLLGDPVYKTMVTPEADYSPSGSFGALNTFGEPGKKDAYGRALGEENSKIAVYLLQHPDILNSFIGNAK